MRSRNELQPDNAIGRDARHLLLQLAMMPKLFSRISLALVIVFATVFQPADAQSPQTRIGVVVMHGKGGLPTGYVAPLASFLEEKGHLVANIEMPWSRRRQYDVDVAGAEKEVQSALAELRRKGATKLFVAGHSQGALFALHCGGRHSIDGVIAIAPGGNVANALFRQHLGEAVERARKLVADGKGDERTNFIDFEGSRGTFPLMATPAAYLSWFHTDGAMNQSISAKSVKVPVLFIAPTGDYPGLLRVKQRMFDALPRHPLTKLYEPDSTHVDAPSASRDEILRWTSQVASSG
jgi:pimeloyl-ACP methyl ester carboxylesterase